MINFLFTQSLVDWFKILLSCKSSKHNLKKKPYHPIFNSDIAFYELDLACKANFQATLSSKMRKKCFRNLPT